MKIICETVAMLLGVFLLTNQAFSQSARTNRFEIEGGVLFTYNMEIYGYNQANATNGWKSTAPEIRFEYWSVDKNGWNFGGILQPLYVEYSDKLTSDLNYKGNVYKSGDDGKLIYQFHSMRATANYPVLTSSSGEDYLRLGGTAILRYADLQFSASGNSFHDTNLILFPLFNVEANVGIGKSYSFFTREDFLPSPTGSVFLDGLFDVFVGIRKKLNAGSAFDTGVRLFFGGYDPNKPDDYANKIFFDAIVVRYSW
jgi:hypothetical protein